MNYPEGKNPCARSVVRQYILALQIGIPSG
jgi:hypothetical protein